MLSLLLCLALTCVFFASCMAQSETPSGGDQQGSAQAPVDGYVYTPGSDLWVIYPTDVSSDALQALVGRLEGVRGELVKFANTDSEIHSSEIIIGKSDRAVSKKAYTLLSRQTKDSSKEVGYVAYTDGKSIALAYDADVFDSNIAIKKLVDKFCEEYITSDKLKIKSGVIYNETIDVIEAQRELDVKTREVAWQSLRTKMIEREGISLERADEIITALKKYYELLNPKVFTWLANLYDKDAGGFYYSNSGRNTIGYGPDIESTRQALTMLENSGILAGYSGLDDALPDWMGDQIGRWAKSLQRPNGFFYHPQWEISAHKDSRLSRDLGQAIALLHYFGYQPTYDTPYGEKGDGLDADGNPIAPASKVTAKLRTTNVVSVSRIVPASSVSYPAHLQTPEAFKKYLENEIHINEDPYRMSNQLATQCSVILTRGQEYRDILINFLDERQNPETGFWTLDSYQYAHRGWEGINCLLKLSDVYNQCKAPIRNAAKAANTCFDVLMSAEDETFGSVCYVYNPWFAIENLRDNIQKYGNGDMTEINALRKRIFDIAPEAIERTAHAISLFFKPDGSASFGQNSTADTSVGMRVAVAGTNEGDVNGTLINMFGSLNHMMGVLGYDYVKPFGKAEYMVFINEINGLGTIIKDQVEDPDPIDFDDSSVDEVYNDFTYHIASEGTITVQKSPKGDGNALFIDSYTGGNDSVIFPSATASLSSNRLYYEADYYVEEASGTFVQINFHPYVYMISLHADDYDGDGVKDDIRLTEDSTASWSSSVTETIGTIAKFGEWFNIRIEEYFAEEAEEIRCLIYVNGELRAITNNYFGRQLTSDVTPPTYCEGARVSVLSSNRVKMYVDNVLMNMTSDSYVAPSKFPEDMIVNVDAPAKEELTYGFEDGIIPENALLNKGGNSYEIVGGEGAKKLLISGSSVSALELPTHLVSPVGNCTAFEADLTVDPTTADGATWALIWRGRNASRETLVRVHLVSCGTGENGYTTVAMAHTGVTGAHIKEINIPHGESFNLRVEFYQREKTVLIYVNGGLIASSDLITTRAAVCEVGSIAFENVSSGKSSSVSLDDLKVERIVSSFANATRPQVPENKYTFEDGIASDLTVSGATVKDGALVLDGASSLVKIPVNLRSVIRTATVLEMTLDTRELKSGFEIRFTDSEDNICFILKFARIGNMIEVYEQSANSSYSAVVASWSVRRATLKINYTPDKEMIVISVDGEAIGATSILYTEGAKALDCRYAVIKADSASGLIIDNCIAESYNMLYVKPNVSNGTSDTGSAQYTFENSTTGGTPTDIAKKLVSAGAALKVKESLRGDKYTKVLALSTTPGANDSITFPITRDVAGMNGIALDFWFKTNAGTTDVMFRVGETTLTGFYLAGDEICDYKNGSYSYSVKSVNLKQWHKLRFEYALTEYDYDGDGKNDMIMKVYVDGELVATGNHTWAAETAPASSITAIMFYTHSASEGDILFDDVTIERCKVEYDPPEEKPVIPEATLEPGSYFEYMVGGSHGWGATYDGLAFWKLCVRNGSATKKFLEISNQMNDFESNTYVSPDTFGGESMYKIAKKGGNHSIPELIFYNVNAADKNCLVFESDVVFSAQNTDQVSASSIYFSRFGFITDYSRDYNITGVKTTSKMIHMGELMGEFDPAADTWGALTFGTATVTSDTKYTLTVEYYKAEGVICYYIDGTLVLTEAAARDVECKAFAIQLQGQAYGSTIYFDNTFLGTVDLSFDGEMPERHEHTYAETFSYDEVNHWYAATCSDNLECETAREDLAPHSYNAENVCACGHTKHVHTFSETLRYDNEYHWYPSTCTGTDTCADTVKDKAAHAFDADGKCVCGYAYRELALTESYYTTQKAAGEQTFDYSSYSYWNYASNNTGTTSRYKFLANHDGMSADLVSTAHAEVETFADGGRALKIGKGTSGDHRISQIQFANLNSADKNCFVFESDIQFNIEATNQVTAAKQYFARISVLNNFGDRIQANTNGYMPTKNDGAYYFEFGGAFDTETGTWTNVGINGFNVESGKWYKMAIEYYKAENTMKLYFDGYLISTVEGLDANFAPVAGVIQLQGQALGSSIYVDNTYVGTVDKTYSAE